MDFSPSSLICRPFCGHFLFVSSDMKMENIMVMQNIDWTQRWLLLRQQILPRTTPGGAHIYFIFSLWCRSFFVCDSTESCHDMSLFWNNTTANVAATPRSQRQAIAIVIPVRQLMMAENSTNSSIISLTSAWSHLRKRSDRVVAASSSWSKGWKTQKIWVLACAGSPQKMKLVCAISLTNTCKLLVYPLESACWLFHTKPK